jgi:hypothetical protein
MVVEVVDGLTAAQDSQRAGSRIDKPIAQTVKVVRSGVEFQIHDFITTLLIFVVRHWLIPKALRIYIIFFITILINFHSAQTVF